MTDRPTDQPTDRQTGMRVHGEVSLPTNVDYIYSDKINALSWSMEVKLLVLLGNYDGQTDMRVHGEVSLPITSSGVRQVSWIIKVQAQLGTKIYYLITS